MNPKPLGLALVAGWLVTLALPALAAAAKPAPVAGNAKVQDLPLVVAPAPDTKSDTLCVLISGDGGWAAIDKGISATMAAQGVPVVGLNALKYFWTKRTPEEASKALARILRHYLRAWHKDKAVVVGYSFGADVLPFMVSRLPDDLRGRIQLVALLGPSPTATFQFHFAEWLPIKVTEKGLPTKPEVAKLKGLKVLCIYGADDTDSLGPQLDPGMAKIIKLPGAHHFDKDYDKLARLILKEL